MRVQSTRSILLLLSGNAPISRRRGSIRALCIHLNQATSMFQLSRDPTTFFALDQAIDDLTFARNVCRCDQRKIRTACGKRTVTTTTDHSSATDQTTDIQEAGSAPLGTSGQDGPNLETSPLHCPAGDHPRLPSSALPFVLEAQIDSAFERSEALASDDRLAQG